MSVRLKRKGRKLLIALCCVLALLAVVYFAWGRTYLDRHYAESVVDFESATDLSVPMEGKTLVVYFTRLGNSDFAPDVDAVSSASLMRDGERLIGNSELIAATIARATGGALFAVQTQDKYPSSYNETVAWANEEFRGTRLVALSGQQPSISEYDRVFVVFPIWWGKLPMAMRLFCQQQDWSKARLYCIVTHGGSREGQCISELEQITGVPVLDHMPIYDKDCTQSRQAIEAWLTRIAES